MARVSNPKQFVKGATGDWEIVVGMEVHAQVSSKSKLFSGASTEFGGAPNSHVSLVDAAMPGMLPVINAECVAQAVRTGLGLKAKVNLKSRFDRKNYFYPDLPQGYQISQYQQPIVGEGEVSVDLPEGETFSVGVERLHLEQDAGKSLHDQHATMSYVDLNRSGVALMEIVSKPDIRSADEAKAYLTKLRSILRYLGTCDGDMEKGSLRADVNVSVRRPGEPLGTRCEIKNVNSDPFCRRGDRARGSPADCDHRGRRHHRSGNPPVRSGQGRDARHALQGRSARLPLFPRSGSAAAEFDQAYVDGLAKALPELPDAKLARFVSALGLRPYDASVLVADKENADYFEAVAKGRDAKVAANWVINELAGRLNKEDKPIGESPVSATQLGGLIDLIASNTISGKTAKEVFEILWSEGGDPAAIVETRGLRQVTDTGAIEKLVDDVIAANPDKVADAKTKPAALGWFVGQVMKASQGKANPQAVNALLKSKLGL